MSKRHWDISRRPCSIPAIGTRPRRRFGAPLNFSPRISSRACGCSILRSKTTNSRQRQRPYRYSTRIRPVHLSHRNERFWRFERMIANRPESPFESSVSTATTIRGRCNRPTTPCPRPGGLPMFAALRAKRCRPNQFILRQGPNGFWRTPTKSEGISTVNSRCCWNGTRFRAALP